MQNLHQTEADQRRIGMYDSRFEHDNCGIGAVVNIKGIKSHGTVDNALKIVENLEHRAGKDAEERPAMVLVSYYRFLTDSLRKQPDSWGYSWEMSGITVSVCSFSHRTRWNGIRQRKCLRSLLKRKVWSS